MAVKKSSFEQSVQRLEEIVLRLESGEHDLDESLKLFEEGTALAADCAALLDAAELKVVRLMKGKDGNPVEMEFEHGN